MNEGSLLRFYWVPSQCRWLHRCKVTG